MDETETGPGSMVGMSARLNVLETVVATLTHVICADPRKAERIMVLIQKEADRARGLPGEELTAALLQARVDAYRRP